jgi:deoxyadenosine/deoxycytidine kinase
VSENPYLEDFYANMQDWAFHSQIYFLSNRLRAQRQLIDHPTSVIQDRTIYEDAEIFARNLYQQGLISERDYATYWDLYVVMTEFLPAPDLVVYLRAPVNTLIERISSRGRDFELAISEKYLAQLNELYETWISNFSLCPILTVPADTINYVDHSGHLDLVVEKVKERLTGKEEVVFSMEEVARSR